MTDLLPCRSTAAVAVIIQPCFHIKKKRKHDLLPIEAATALTIESTPQAVVQSMAACTAL